MQGLAEWQIIIIVPCIHLEWSGLQWWRLCDLCWVCLCSELASSSWKAAAWPGCLNSQHCSLARWALSPAAQTLFCCCLPLECQQKAVVSSLKSLHPWYSGLITAKSGLKGENAVLLILIKRNRSATCCAGDSAKVPKHRHLLWGLYWINRLRYGKN